VGRSSTKAKISWQGKKIEQLTVKALTAGVRAGAIHGRAQLRAELRKPGPSSPGSPPGMRSGQLAKAVTFRIKTRKGKYVLADVGVLNPSPQDANAKGKTFKGRMHAQALRLDRGYVGRDRLGRVYNEPARPFIRPVLDRERRVMIRKAREASRQWMPKAKTKG
jgi:hypothetical protein